MLNVTWLYVGAIYVFSIKIARRFVEIPWSIAALFYLLTLLFFFRPMTGQFVNLPTDVVALIAPWSATNSVSKFTVSNPQLNDVIMQLVPWADEVRHAWRGGRLPLWQDGTATGSSLLGNGQSSAFSPLRLLALPLPLGYAISAEGAMKVLCALTFTYLYCRRRRYGDWASIIGALSYGFSLFVIVWLHFSLTMVAAFLPAIFLSIDLLAEHVSWRRISFAAFVWAAAVFGGHIETVAHIAFLSLAYVLWIAIVERKPLRFAGGIGVSALLAAILSSPFLIALGQTIVRSLRMQNLRSDPYGEIPFSDWPSLFVSLQPRFFGWIPREPLWASPAHAESISGFAGTLAVVGCVAVLIDAIVTRRWRDREVFFAMCWLFTLAVLASVPGLRQVITTIIPFTAHARMRVLLCWLGALLAAAFVERVRSRTAIVAAIAIVSAILIYAFVDIGVPDEHLRQALVTTVPAAVVLICALLCARFRIAPLLALAVLVDLWLPGYDWNPVRPIASLYPRTPIIDALKQMTHGPYRVVGIDDMLFPNTNAIFDLQDVRQHDPLANAAYVRLVATTMAKYDPRDYYAKWTDTRTPLLDRLNVRWVVTNAHVELDDPSRFREAYSGYDGHIYENLHVLPRFFSDGRALVRIEKARTTRYDLRVQSSGRARVESSVPFWPGWRVTIDGSRVDPVEVSGAFIGFDVPSGSHAVVVRYAPFAIYAALAAALLTAIVLVIMSAREVA